MIDKAMTVKRDKLGEAFGSANDEVMLEIGCCLAALRLLAGRRLPRRARRRAAPEQAHPLLVRKGAAHARQALEPDFINKHARPAALGAALWCMNPGPSTPRKAQATGGTKIVGAATASVCG